MYSEEDYLMLSGIQHYYFCKRQWALIHIEQLWEENHHTIIGQSLHIKTDNPYIKEKRGDLIITRSVPVSSKQLGLSGVIDTLELKKSETGIPLANKKGLWKPTIVEYKKGKAKKDERDIIQLVAQVICLEEKLYTTIKYSDLYYFESNQRVRIEITDALKNKAIEMSNQMHEMYTMKITPDAEYFKNCTLCSLYDICMPRISKKKKSVKNYLYGDLDEETP